MNPLMLQRSIKSMKKVNLLTAPQPKPGSKHSHVRWNDSAHAQIMGGSSVLPFRKKKI